MNLSFTSTFQSIQTIQVRTQGVAQSQSADGTPTAPSDSPEKSRDVSSTDDSVIQRGPRQSAEVTAGNILKHVMKGIDALKAQGASEEAITARLDAARAGIAAGYADARDTLDGMGLLDESLAEDIGRSESLIREGLDALEQGEVPAVLTGDAVTPESPEQEASATTTSESPSSVVSASTVAPQGDDNPIISSSTTTGTRETSIVASESSRRSREILGSGSDASRDVTAEASARRTSSRLTLEVLTQDGDRVRVDFRQRSGELNVDVAGLSASMSGFSQRFDLQVDGSLDDGELQALQTLFEDVQSLSDTFFNGDLGAALEEAMTLGFDGNELAAMSLDMRQRSFSSVARAYGEAGPSLPTSRLESQSNRIVDYVDAYLKALDRANPLRDARDTLSQMMEQLAPDERLAASAKAYHQGLGRLLG